MNRYAADAGDSIQSDVQLLSIGYVLIIIYVAIMLGKFTRLNVKVRSNCQPPCSTIDGKMHFGQQGGEGALGTSITPKVLSTLYFIQNIQFIMHVNFCIIIRLNC